MDATTSDTLDLRRLLHRWFVEYNPLYLISATLCIAGLRMISLGLAERGSVVSDISVGAMTELYALALIGGAALLTRLGLRRPAVMLALLAALYQGDVIFHVEASSYLHGAGIAAAAAWFVVFVAKLRGIAWALRLRPSRSAMLLVTYGGLGLAAVPQIVNRMEIAPRGAVVAIWLFGLVAFAINTSPRIESIATLDDWGRTVLRRSVIGVWALWASLVGLHVYFWSTTFPLRLGALVPAACLLGTRWARRESHVWLVVATTLVIVAIQAPHDFSLTAFMAAATLAVRIRRHHHEVGARDATLAAAAPPFRVGPDLANPKEIDAPAWFIAPASPAMRGRLLVGISFATYLGLWTLRWSDGPWPHHLVWLDVSMTLVMLALVTRARGRIAWLPLVATCAHLLVQSQTVSAPRSLLQWGLASMGTAYVLLFGSLAANYFLRNAGASKADVPRAEPDPAS